MSVVGGKGKNELKGMTKKVIPFFILVCILKKICLSLLKQLNIKVMDNKETLEEAAERYTEEHKWEEQDPWFDFMEGAKWQQERMYSEEDMKVFGQFLINNLGKFEFKTIDEVFEQFKK